ncbi:hypothetical protein ES703_72388 [subsurface metagenome]
MPITCREYAPTIINRMWPFPTRSAIIPPTNLAGTLAPTYNVIMPAATSGSMPISVRKGIQCTLTPVIVRPWIA